MLQRYKKRAKEKKKRARLLTQGKYDASGCNFFFFLTNKLHITSLWQPTSFNHRSDSTLWRLLHQSFLPSSRATYKIGCIQQQTLSASPQRTPNRILGQRLRLNGGAGAAALSALVVKRQRLGLSVKGRSESWLLPLLLQRPEEKQSRRSRSTPPSPPASSLPLVSGN